ncbi:hypothetical protein NKG05_22390 [Oerskovia sp. M15]
MVGEDTRGPLRVPVGDVLDGKLEDVEAPPGDARRDLAQGGVGQG